MPYTPVAVESWGGLNLRDDPTEVGLSSAIAMSDVDLDQSGRLRTRSGYTQTGNATTGIGSGMCYYASGGNEYIVTKVGANANPVKLPSGTSGTTSAGGPGQNNSMVRHGTPTSSRLYFVDGTTTMRKFDGTTWGTVTLPIAATVITVMADNRLLVGDQADQVAWSDPENPDLWGSTDTQALGPGDGGAGLTALVTWRELTFAFKLDKFYVITGFSTDGAGGTLMDYRPVTAGGRGTYLDGCACAGDQGVYFAGNDGIYLTDGDVPRLVSEPLGYPSLLFTGVLTVCYYQHRLYVPTAAATYVFDTRLQTWLKWSARFVGMCVVPDLATTPGVYVVKNTGGGLLARLSSTATTDNGTTDTNGTAISWSYTSGYSDLGAPDRKTVREFSLWGQGTDPSFRYVMDGASGSTVTVDIPASSFGEGVGRTAARGTYVGYILSGTGTTNLSRLTLRVRDVELPR